MVVQRQFERGFNDAKRVLCYKLVILEQIRNALEKDLVFFTEKANKLVQDFLNMTDVMSAQDYTQLVMTLNVKCNIIQRLAEFFQQLKGIEPHCGLNGTPVTDHLCQSTPVSYCASGNGDIRVSDMLHFGPMLQNGLMGSSVTNTVRTIGAMPYLHNIQMAQVSCSDTVLLSASSSHQHNIQVCNSLSGDKRESTSAASKRESVYPLQAPRRYPSKKVAFSRPQAAPVPKINSMVRHISPQLPNWGQGSCVRVQHQKQTASQLIRFIRSSDNTGLGQVTFSRGKASASPWQQETTDKKLANKERKISLSLVKRPFSSLVPVFKRKGNCSTGCLVYSCVVASNYEVWDVADVFTEDVCGVSEQPVGQVTQSLIDSSGASYLEVLGSAWQESQPSSGVSSSASSGVSSSASSGVSSSASSGVSSSASSGVSSSASRNVGSGSPNTGPAPVGTLDAAVKIPEFKIRKFEEMEVTVSHLVSPSKFFIQHVGSELPQLSQMMDSLKSRSSLAQMNCVPDMGSCVAGWFPEHKLWCRAQVLRICGMRAEASQTSEDGEKTGGDWRHIELEVRRIDFGDIARLPLYHLRELDEQTAAVPAQALQVALANVSPVDGQDWTPDAVDWFRDKVNGKTLYARFFPQGKDVRIELFMEKGKIGAMRRGSSLSLRLAQNGHANHSDLKRWKGSVLGRTRGEASQWERNLISSYSQHWK